MWAFYCYIVTVFLAVTFVGIVVAWIPSIIVLVLQIVAWIKFSVITLSSQPKV
ncbi:hypothetical protein [Helicobacter monodelphidis]|uniref:hypothetical protein n=1 Tax=Helicobacter sp. 15-1451 TaxID=2004995 RepID=UPI0015EBD614|nr:hypothetical protein [Helicobacter sp. 15-1451]